MELSKFKMFALNHPKPRTKNDKELTVKSNKSSVRAARVPIADIFQQHQSARCTSLPSLWVGQTGDFMALPTTPINTTPTRNKGLIRPYSGTMVAKNPSISFLVGVVLMGVVGRAMMIRLQLATNLQTSRITSGKKSSRNLLASVCSSLRSIVESKCNACCKETSERQRSMTWPHEKNHAWIWGYICMLGSYMLFCLTY